MTRFFHERAGTEQYGGESKIGMFRYFFLLATMLAAEPVWGCSCFQMETPCSVLGGTAVVFVADVKVDSGEGIGKGPAKVVVVEALQNVPKDLKEVEIATMAGTSCYRRLQAGKRYVIITTSSFSIGTCNESFELAGNEHLLTAMRNRLQGGGPSLVGVVLKRPGFYWRERDSGGAVVELQRGAELYSTIADGESRYSITRISPGRYQLRVRKNGFSPDEEFNNGWTGEWVLNAQTRSWEPFRDSPGEVEIRANSCRIRNLALWTAGNLQGTVRNLGGATLAGIKVEAFALDQKGKREGFPSRSAVSGPDGRYRIEALPPGRYVVGINAHASGDYSVYPATLYASGKPVSVPESTTTLGVDLVVPSARKPAQLRVQILTKDGKPAAGVWVTLASEAGSPRWTSGRPSDGQGQILAPVYVGERYLVKVLRSDSAKGIASVNISEEGQAVNVVLREVVQGRK